MPNEIDDFASIASAGQPQPNGRFSRAELQAADGASPHNLVFKIKERSTGNYLLDPESKKPFAWFRTFPTRDAADSERADLLEMLRRPKGEPEQAFSEVARQTRCPNPALIRPGWTLEIQLLPAPTEKRLDPNGPTAQRIAREHSLEQDSAGNLPRPGGKGANSGKSPRPRKRAPARKAKSPRGGAKGKAQARSPKSRKT